MPIREPLTSFAKLLTQGHQLDQGPSSLPTLTGGSIRGHGAVMWMHDSVAHRVPLRRCGRCCGCLWISGSLMGLRSRRMRFTRRLRGRLRVVTAVVPAQVVGAATDLCLGVFVIGPDADPG